MPYRVILFASFISICFIVMFIVCVVEYKHYDTQDNSIDIKAVIAELVPFLRFK